MSAKQCEEIKWVLKSISFGPGMPTFTLKLYPGKPSSIDILICHLVYFPMECSCSPWSLVSDHYTFKTAVGSNFCDPVLWPLRKGMSSDLIVKTATNTQRHLCQCSSPKKNRDYPVQMIYRFLEYQGRAESPPWFPMCSAQEVFSYLSKHFSMKGFPRWTFSSAPVLWYCFGGFCI